MSRHRNTLIGAIWLLATPAVAASYEAELDPVPFDASNRAAVIDSIGTVTASLDGSTLNIHGTFANLTSPATQGSVHIGLAKGVPGDAIGVLSVDHDRQGSFQGSLKLKPPQIAALKKEALYIRIDSEKAPDGNLQGWLEETGNN